MTTAIDRILRLAFYLAATAFAIASVAGAAPASKVPAPTATAIVPETVVRSVLESWVAEQLAASAGQDDDGITRHEIEARWQGDLLLDDAGIVDFRVRRLSSRPFRGPTVVRLELLIDDAVARAMTVTVDCRHYRPVVVTSQSIRREGELSTEALFVEERDVTSLKHGWFEDVTDLEVMRARRPIGVGEVVTERHVEAIPVVHRGTDVVLSVRTGSMAIDAIGEALADGGLGERIRVRNVDSGKILYGQIVNADTVRVGS